MRPHIRPSSRVAAASWRSDADRPPLRVIRRPGNTSASLNTRSGRSGGTCGPKLDVKRLCADQSASVLVSSLPFIVPTRAGARHLSVLGRAEAAEDGGTRVNDDVRDGSRVGDLVNVLRELLEGGLRHSPTCGTQPGRVTDMSWTGARRSPPIAHTGEKRRPGGEAALDRDGAAMRLRHRLGERARAVAVEHKARLEGREGRGWSPGEREGCRRVLRWRERAP